MKTRHRGRVPGPGRRRSPDRKRGSKPVLGSRPRHYLTLLASWSYLASPIIAASAPPADLELLEVATGLSRPVELRHANDDSGRLFIVEQGGTIRIWDGQRLLPSPFLDVSSLIEDSGGEEGLLGLAFDPDFATNGYFYVYLTRPPGIGPDESAIVRYSASTNDPDLADPSTATDILVVDQPLDNHNGGGMHFGPDGYLYIGLGDGGGSGDPGNRAQDPSTLLGKMLRIDIREGGGPPDCGKVGAYTVPADNPFVDGSAGVCDEIWALGLRNPWRWSFDRLTGAMFIGDVGQNSVEEIDIEPWPSPGGLNFGWRCFEGSTAFATTGCTDPSHYTFPIIEYGHLAGSCGGGSGSVTGGYVYRGYTIAALLGVYVYADFCTGHIGFASDPGSGWSTTPWSESLPFVTTFGEDQRGELYLATVGGALFRLDSPSAIYANGFEAGTLDGGWTSAVP